MSIKDQLATGGNPERLRMAAFRVVDRTQDDPATQIRGTALALVALCRATGTDIRQLLIGTERMLNDIDSPFGRQLRAIEDYARNEIGRS